MILYSPGTSEISHNSQKEVITKRRKDDCIYLIMLERPHEGGDSPIHILGLLWGTTAGHTD